MSARLPAADEPGAEVGGLYPFLASAPVDPAAVLAGVRASTREKAHEIMTLRQRLAGQYAAELATAALAMARRFAAGARLYAFGNGGSSTDAQQVVTALLRPRRGRPLPAISLTSDTAVVTALSNDVGFEVVFARQLAAMARPCDIAFGLSTSGGSRNVVSALEQAAQRGLLTIAVAGDRGGRLAELTAAAATAANATTSAGPARAATLDHLFVVPSASVHRVQEGQTTLYHVLTELTQYALDLLADPAAARAAGVGAAARSAANDPRGSGSTRERRAAT